MEDMASLLLEFLESTYAAAARLGQRDREALQRHELPDIRASDGLKAPRG